MDDYLWPEQGLEPFVDDAADWEHNAWLPDRPDWILYRVAYTRAADVMATHIIETNSDQDVLIYPLLFASRHAVELGLKHATLLAQSYLNEEPALEPTHDLMRLWETARPLFERVDSRSLEDYDAMQEALGHLVEVDAGSFAFRYPVERDNKTASFNLDNSTLKRLINVRELKEWMDRLAHFFDGIISELLVYLEAKADMAADYEP